MESIKIVEQLKQIKNGLENYVADLTNSIDKTNFETLSKIAEKIIENKENRAVRGFLLFYVKGLLQKDY